MKYQIVSAIKEREYETKFGKMVSYILALKDEQGNELTAKLSQKPESPKPQDSIEGHIEESPYGPKFVKEKSFEPRSGGNGGGFRQADPEVQSAIIRQHSITASISFLSKRADLEKADEGRRIFTLENVLLYATKIAEYTSGKAKVASTPLKDEPLSEAEGPQDFPDEPELVKVGPDEIDISQMPF